MFAFPKEIARRLALFGAALFFTAAGIAHFTQTDFFVAIMPPYLPAHLELVYVSGIFEILGGVAVLFPNIRVLAGWGLILLLLAVYPANIHMALHPELFPVLPVLGLYARLPLQFVLIAWAYWATRPESPATTI